MDSVERVRKAIKFEGPDRVPIISMTYRHNDFGVLFELPPRDWLPPDPYYPYTMGDFVMRTHLWTPKKDYPKGWMDSSYRAVDEWGSEWEMDGNVNRSLGAFKTPPLKDWSDLDRWKAPDPHDQTRYERLERLMQLFAGKYVFGTIQYFAFTRMTFLRGFENLMMDFYDHPEKIKRLASILTDYSLGLIDEYKRLGAHAIFALDDLGSQQAPFISPDTFQEFIADIYAHCSSRAHELGMDFWLHCCGRVNKLLPALVKAGVDLFEFDSPSHTGIEEVAKEFGGRVAFAGCPDIQDAFQNQSPEAIEVFIKRMIKSYGAYNGGFVYYEYPDWKLLKIPEANVKAAREAVIKWGTYPLKH